MHSTFSVVSPFQKPVSRPKPVFSGALQANSLKDNQDSFTKTAGVLFGKNDNDDKPLSDEAKKLQRELSRENVKVTLKAKDGKPVVNQ